MTSPRIFASVARVCPHSVFLFLRQGESEQNGDVPKEYQSKMDALD